MKKQVMSIREFFLGRLVVKSFGGKLGGKKRQVIILPGATDIFIDQHYGIIMPRWSRADRGKTPVQRSKEKWRSENIQWTFYPQGLPSALRSRQLALLRAQKISLPTLEKILQVFEGDVRANLVEADPKLDPRQFPTELRNRLRQSGFVLRRGRKPGMKEALIQIIFLYRDYQRGLNVGAMLTRTVAITDRLRERLRGLYAWTAKFSAQERVLQMMQEYIYSLLGEARKQLKLLSRSDPAKSRIQQKVITDKLNMLAQQVEPLRVVQPFSRWTMFMLEDFEETFQALRREDYVLFRALIERMKFSLELKRCQQEIDSFLLRLGQDEILGKEKLRWVVYSDWASQLSRAFMGLVEKERVVGLREKVCSKVAIFLAQAVIQAELCRLKGFKLCIKQANAAL